MSYSQNKPFKLLGSKQQQGTVLITVLLVVAFVVILVVNVNKTVTYQASLNRNLMYRDQAYSYLIGMEELAKIYLKKSFDAEKSDLVHLGQSWAQQDITFPITGGVMSATVTDMQSCLNLNSIALADAATSPGQGVAAPGAVRSSVNPNNGINNETTGEKILTLLVEKVLTDTDVNASALSAELKDWLDEDLTPSGPDGVEDLYYQGLDIPYLPPNGPIAHISELRAIKSFDKITYSKISQYLCVLPDEKQNKLNVNTISQEHSELLYAALGGKVDQNKVDELISERPEEGYELQDFWDKVGTGLTINKELKQRLDISSVYFQMSARAEIDRTKVYLKTLFIKEDDNQFKVVSRYFGKE